MSLSLSYLRESNKAQRQKLEALRLKSDYNNRTDTWRNVPEGCPHGARHMYKSLEAAAMMLRMGSESLRRLLSSAEHKHFYETLDYLEQRTQLCSSYCDKAIVIEGPQGSGVSTLIKNLSELFLNSTTSDQENAPKKWKGILGVHDKLQGLPVPLVDAFECVCDYCSIVDVGSEDGSANSSNDRIVFIERLYHSRVSNILCNKSEQVDITQVPDSAFQWPKDLPVPALVIYLVLPHDERGQRAGQLPISVTEYNKIQLVHSKIRGAEFVPIDASGHQEDVLETVLQCCESHGIHLRNANCGPMMMNEDTGDHRNQGENISDTDDKEGDQAIVINLSDAPLPCRHERGDRREYSQRQSLGWYGAFMSGGDE